MAPRKAPVMSGGGTDEDLRRGYRVVPGQDVRVRMTFPEFLEPGVVLEPARDLLPEPVDLAGVVVAGPKSGTLPTLADAARRMRAECRRQFIQGRSIAAREAVRRTIARVPSSDSSRRCPPRQRSHQVVAGSW